MLQCCYKQKLSCLYILLLAMLISSVRQLGFNEKTFFDWELWLFNTLVLTTPSPELHLFSLCLSCGPAHHQLSLAQTYFGTTRSQISDKYKCAKQISGTHTGFLHSASQGPYKAFFTKSGVVTGIERNRRSRSLLSLFQPPGRAERRDQLLGCPGFSGLLSYGKTVPKQREAPWW